MMASYERVVQFLADFESPEKIKRVEKDFESFQDDPIFINLLQIIIRDKFVASSIKLTAAVTLNKVILDKYHEFDSQNMLMLLIELMLDMTVDFKLKVAVEPSLNTILELTVSDQIEEISSTLSLLLKSLQAIIYGKINVIKLSEKIQITCQTEKEAVEIIRVFILIFRSMASSNNNIQLMEELIKENFQRSLTIINTKAANMSEGSLAIVGELARMWLGVADNVRSIGNSNAEFEQLADFLCLSEALTEWVYGIYMVGCKANQQCFITANASQNHDLLNRLKRDATDLHRITLLQMGSTRCKQKFQKLVQKNFNRLECIVNTISLYNSHTTYLKCYQQFITGLIGNLLILYRQNSQFFSQIYANILHMVIFPCLAITDEEKILFEEEPQQFNRLNEDCCDHQNFGVLKTEAAMFLESMCDESEQVATYTLIHAILSLKARLSIDQNISFQASKFLTIQTAFIVLSILSYRLNRHVNQLNQLRTIVQFAKIQNRLDNLEMCRLFAFLAYNYVDLYKDPLEGQQWVKRALNCSNHKTLNLTALDFISNVVQQYFSEVFLIEFSKQLPFGRNNSQETLRLTALTKIVLGHLPKISEEGICFVIDKLYENMDIEITRYEQREKSHTMDIVSTLHLFKRLIEKKQFSNKKEIMKQKIWKVVNYLPKLKKIYLDQQVVIIVTKFMLLQNAVTEQIYAAIQLFTNLYLLDQHQNTTYLIFYNTLINMGTLQMMTPILNLLSQALITLVNKISEVKTAIKEKIGISNIYMLLQNVVAKYGTQLVPEAIDKIVGLAKLMIPADDNPEDKTSFIIIARALNLLFLCHMHHRKNDEALRILLKFQQSPIFKGYDLKVLCSCLCKEIFRDKDIVSVTEMINLSVKAIYLGREEPTITSKTKKKPIKVTNTKFTIKRVEQYEQILKFTSTPFMLEPIPELSVRNTIQAMRVNNSQLYQAIINSLTTQVRGKLTLLMSEAVIQGKKRQIIHPGAIKLTPKLSAQNQNNNLKRSLEQNDLESDKDDEQEEQVVSKRKNLQRKKLKGEKPQEN